jgi:hypothetical protein
MDIGRLRDRVLKRTKRPRRLRPRYLRSRGGVVGGDYRRYLRRDDPRSYGREPLAALYRSCCAAPIAWLSDTGSCYRAREEMLFAQWIGLFPLLHARTFSVVERDGRVLRQNVQARLCLRSRSTRCTIRLGATSTVVRGLQRKPSVQSPANEVTP